MQQCQACCAPHCDICNALVQVETDPILHYVIDIRSSEQRSGQPLPQDLQDALHIPGVNKCVHLWIPGC